MYKRIYVTGHRASICCPYRKRIGEEIGTRLTFERSRDVTRECSRVSYHLFYCTGGTSTWSRHLVQTHTQLTYPFVPEVHMFRGRSASKPNNQPNFHYQYTSVQNCVREKKGRKRSYSIFTRNWNRNLRIIVYTHLSPIILFNLQVFASRSWLASIISFQLILTAN